MAVASRATAIVVAAIAAGEAEAYAEGAASAVVFARRIKRNRPVRIDGRAGLAASVVASDRRREERLWARREVRLRRLSERGATHPAERDVQLWPFRRVDRPTATAAEREGLAPDDGVRRRRSNREVLNDSTFSEGESTAEECEEGTPQREAAEGAAGGDGVEGEGGARRIATALVVVGVCTIALGEATGSILLEAVGAVIVWKAAQRALR